LLSQYRYNLIKSEGPKFRSFLKHYIPETQQTLNKTDKLKYYDVTLGKMGWIDHEMGNFPRKGPYDYAWIIWEAYRNGIIHSGMVVAYGGHHREKKNLVEIERPWLDNNYIFVILNPIIFLTKCREALINYLDDVRTNCITERKFKKKFYRDFGYKI
jgi:hypothetical protein